MADPQFNARIPQYNSGEYPTVSPTTPKAPPPKYQPLTNQAITSNDRCKPDETIQEKRSSYIREDSTNTSGLCCWGCFGEGGGDYRRSRKRTGYGGEFSSSNNDRGRSDNGVSWNHWWSSDNDDNSRRIDDSHYTDSSHHVNTSNHCSSGGGWGGGHSVDIGGSHYIDSSHHVNTSNGGWGGGHSGGGHSGGGHSEGGHCDGGDSGGGHSGDSGGGDCGGGGDSGGGDCGGGGGDD